MSASLHTPLVPGGRVPSGMTTPAGLNAPALAGAEPRYDTPRSARAAMRRLASAQLFDGRTEIEIEHGESVYRLRLTALGKLILTK